MAVKHLKAKVKAFFERAFPERQIYHRSGGAVRYVSISPWRQAMMAGVATVVVGWCLFATVAVLLRGPAVDAGGPSDRSASRLEREVRNAKAAEETALALLEARTADFKRAMEEAEDRHETLKRLVSSSFQKLDSASAIALTGESSLLINSTIEEGDPRQSRPDWQKSSAAATGSSFRDRTDRLIEDQASLLDALEEEAVKRSEGARGVIRLTGVPASRVLEQYGVGGPLVPINYTALGRDAPSDPFKRRVMEVEARLREAEDYERAVHSLPLGIPVQGMYRETSGFGYRPDPFTRRTAFHEGTDFGAFTGAPIIATAPGKVVHAGVKGGYGRTVEIDHGQGFRTLYGHMNTISVKLGQDVVIGQKIGTMGSTGRSTGPHLHYEIYFRGKAYDPIKFLRAGKHVH